MNEPQGSGPASLAGITVGQRVVTAYGELTVATVHAAGALLEVTYRKFPGVRARYPAPYRLPFLAPTAPLTAPRATLTQGEPQGWTTPPPQDRTNRPVPRTAPQPTLAWERFSATCTMPSTTGT